MRYTHPWRHLRTPPAFGFALRRAFCCIICVGLSMQTIIRLLQNLFGIVDFQRYHTDLPYRAHVRARRRFRKGVAWAEAMPAAGEREVEN